MEFKNEFSWSKSRDGLFRECKRKYWFNHYGFWNGWLNSAPDRVKRIYYLKRLSTKEVWMGGIVHGVIEFLLKRFRVGEHVSLGYALKVLNGRMESDWAMSKMGGYTGFKTNAHRFFEDEYGIEITSEEKEMLFEKARLCLTNFYNSDIFMDIRRTPHESWVTLEEFLSFDFEGTKVYLSIDFAMRVGEKIILFDWKTGRERRADHELQLGLYSLYVSEHFGLNPEKVEAQMVYLGLGSEVKVDSFEVTPQSLEKVRQILRESIAEMKGCLRSVEENEAVEADFVKSIGKQCERCLFRKVCLEDWGQA